jgi:RNA polymerase sigma factor (sigma-70 family)
MRVSESVVIGARLGGGAEFAQIVKAYEKSLYSFALASTRNGTEAEDAVQDIFLSLLVGIRDLREPERLEAWLWAVARNELSARARAKAARPPEAELDPDDVPGGGGAGGAGAGGPGRGGELGPSEDLLLEEVFSALGREEALALSLRYGGGFSVRELGLVLGIGEPKAKSRLYEARKKSRDLAKAGRGRGAASRFSLRRFRIPYGLEERIMDNVETLRMGAFLVERLANDDQMHMACLARRGEAFDERALAALGRMGKGGEFVRRVQKRLDVKEFASILNYTDRCTEKRIIEGLEAVDPETSEALKRSMFVFEDFVLFDPEAFGLLLDEVGETVIALGMGACGAPIREELLAKVAEPRRAALAAALASGSWSPEAARAAQEEAVALARRLDKEGRLMVSQGPGHPRGFVITLGGREGQPGASGRA